jgi:uncharacterized protein
MLNRMTLKPQTEHSFIEIYTGSDLTVRRLPIMTCGGNEKGPVLWLTGCMHGDEVGGIIIIQEIIKYLEKHPLVRGTLKAFPLMNPMGFEYMSRKIPLSEEDLNRNFPGDRNGTLAQRIAHRIFCTILETKPDLVIDLHNDWINSIPYTVIDPFPGNHHKTAYQRTRQLARKTGFLIIDEQGEQKNKRDDLKKSLSGSLLRHDIPAFTLELGEGLIVNEKMITEGVASILNIMRELKMIEDGQPSHIYDAPRPFKNRILWYTQRPSSSSSGIIRFLAEPGDVVQKGQIRAKIYNVFGELQEELKSEHDCIVLGHADSSVAIPGREVMAFGYLPVEEKIHKSAI